MADAYQEYVGRFDGKVGGAVSVGGYGKYEGKLVKKLAPDEFAAKWREYQELRANFDAIVKNGYTISNVLLKVLRERANELIVEPPSL